MFAWLIVALKFRIARWLLLNCPLAKVEEFSQWFRRRFRPYIQTCSPYHVLFTLNPFQKKKCVKDVVPYGWPLCSLSLLLKRLRFHFQFQSFVSLEDHAPCCELYMSGCTIFIHIILYIRYDFRKNKVVENKMCVLIFSITFIWKYCVLRITHQDVIKNVYVLIFMYSFRCQV